MIIFGRYIPEEADNRDPGFKMSNKETLISYTEVAKSCLYQAITYTKSTSKQEAIKKAITAINNI